MADILEDRARDYFGDFRRRGVSECSSSVNPIGKPIICSADPGSSIPRATLTQSQSVIVMPEDKDRPLAVPLRAPLASPAVRVGNNPNALPGLRQANEGSRNAMRFRVIVDLGQVSENFAQPSSKQVCHVLHDRVAGSYQANGTYKFPPEPRIGAGQTGALAGTADIDARESATDDIGLAFLKFPRSHVVMARHGRPVLRQHAPAEGINLNETDRARAGAREPEREAADTAKKVQSSQHLVAFVSLGSQPDKHELFSRFSPPLMIAVL
jgi:hypothetical protein